MSGPGSQNSFAQSAGDMDIPSQYKNTDFGKKVKAVAKKVNIKSSGKDGKFYGARAIMTKECMTFAEYLLEGDDLTMLPDAIVGEIKSNIRAGAKDLEQKWKNALELVHKAYQVTSVRRPTPEQKGAWKQYEELIRFGVQQLSATRGIDGDWRMSQVLVREAAEPEIDKSQQMGKRRFFAEIPGASAAELDGTDMGEIIEQITNKFKRHGARVRVDERNKHGAVLSIWKNGVQIEKMIIKEL